MQAQEERHKKGAFMALSLSPFRVFSFLGFSMVGGGGVEEREEEKVVRRVDAQQL